MSNQLFLLKCGSNVLLIAASLLFLAACDKSPQTESITNNDIKVTVPEPAIPDNFAELDSSTVEQINTAARIVREFPNDAEAWNKLGMILHAREMYNLAARNYEQGLKLSPDNVKVIYYYAMTLYEMGRIEDAIAELDAVISRQQRYYLPALKRRGLMQIEHNDLVRAIICFELVLEINPSDDIALIGLARVHLTLDDTVKAIELLEECIKTQTINQGYAYRLLGTAYTRAGRSEDAGEALKRSRSGSIRINDPWFDELKLLKKAFSDQLLNVEQLLNKGQIDSAIIILNRLRKEDPEHVTVLGNLGVAFFLKQDFDKSIELSNQALKLSPGWYIAYQNLALAYEAKASNAVGEDKKIYSQLAMKHVDKTIELNPSCGPALFLKGRLLLQSNDSESAINFYKDAFKADPKRVDWLYAAAKVEWQTKQYVNCIETINQVFELQPPFAEGLYLQGTAYMAIDNMEEAKSSLEKAKNLAPDNETIRHAYERLLFVLKNRNSGG